MSLYTALDMSYEKKLQSVISYLETGKSLRKIARSWGISYMTLWRWVKKYKEGGEEALRAKNNVYRRSWKRLSKDVEMKIMFLKERNPALSINNARHLINQTGIKVSNKGIWKIWQRYGLLKKPLQDPLSPFGISTPESEEDIRKAKMFVCNGNFKAAAKVLNAIPCLPEYPVIKEIPEELLSSRRKLDRLYLEFWEMPFPEFFKKARRVRKTLEKKGYMYTSIIANFCELLVLDWMHKTQKQKLVLCLIAKKMCKVKDNALWFLFYFQQATFYYRLNKTTTALDYVKKCRKLIYRLPYPYYYATFGALLSTTGNLKESFRYFKMACETEKDVIAFERYAISTALFGYGMNGNYVDGDNLLNKIHTIKNATGYGASYNLARAFISFGQGKLTDASKFFLESLIKASKTQLFNHLYATSLGLALVAMATNNKSEAKIHLQKYLPLMKKHNLILETFMLKLNLGLVETLPEEFIQEPTLRLLNIILLANRTLKIGDYRKAFNYARKNGILGIFHRMIVSFPEPVLQLLRKGKSTGLPRAILTFPIFNQNMPVYHIKFLGDFTVSRNQQYLRTNLTPKEKSFLIHLALRAGATGKLVLLKDLYQNFWPCNRRQSSLLSHMLVRLRKKLNLSSRLLSISSRHGFPSLTNRGVYITTDYDEFEVLLVQIKILERAGEWQLAKKEYSKAFSLFRGEPFKKMYDNQSENMRRVILNKLETEAIYFAKTCLEHKNKNDAKKVLEKVSNIIPNSQEIDKFLKMLPKN